MRQRFQAVDDVPRCLPACLPVRPQISIKGRYAGRIEMVLFAKEAPLYTESFRMLCTGERAGGREGCKRGVGGGAVSAYVFIGAHPHPHA